MRTRAFVFSLVMGLAFGGASAQEPAALPPGAPSASGLSAEPSPLALPDQGTCGEKGDQPCPSPDEKEQGRPAEGGILPAGTAAKAFTLKDPKGKAATFDPARLKKPMLLVFWSVFCEPCKEELPLVGWLGEKYGGEGFRILAVNLDGASMATTAERFLKMNKLSFTTVMDRKEGKRFVAAEAYQVVGTPSLFLVGADGKIRWSHVGRTDAGALEAAVRSALGL